MVTVNLEPSWLEQLNSEFQQQYFQQLADFVRQEYRQQAVFPPGKDIFRAFELCPFEQVKVVILGQDPYHGPGQANGLCFAVNQGVKLPPSLKNIYREIETDLGVKMPNHGDLSGWSRQGVLLLNATLTVRANQAGSHQKKGWEKLTDAAIQTLAQKRRGLVFLLWGNFAQAKSALIEPFLVTNQHLILRSPHPSPLSAYQGFFGCRHFSQTNHFLTQQGLSPIDWSANE